VRTDAGLVSNIKLLKKRHLLQKIETKDGLMVPLPRPVTAADFDSMIDRSVLNLT
jgi:hypothetical protein